MGGFSNEKVPSLVRDARYTQTQTQTLALALAHHVVRDANQGEISAVSYSELQQLTVSK
jgi:hypothetical protein